MKKIIKKVLKGARVKTDQFPTRIGRTAKYQGVGSARDIFRGSGFILQMDRDIILLFSKCYENT